MYFPDSNQQETLRKLQAYQQWANGGAQPQQAQDGWSALSKIADAYGRKQMMDKYLSQDAQPQQNTPAMNVGEGVPSVLEMLSKYAYGGGF
jgi:hypothetical protein